MTPSSVLVGELSDICGDLCVHFALWQELRLPENVEKYSAAILDHREFFDTTADSHLMSTVVLMHVLTDTRDDSLSVPNLLDSIRNYRPGVVTEIEERMNPHGQIFEHVRTIRSKVYAHRDRNIGPDMVFSAAPITPNSLGACVDTLASSVSDLSFALGFSVHPWSVDNGIDGRVRIARDQLRQMLLALSNNSFESDAAKPRTSS